jgi:hypothetical protein
MKKRRIFIIALTLLVPLLMQAQKKKPNKVVKPVVVAPATPAEDPRITEMREVTQQIVFIDSVVIGKKDFLSAIRLNPESGKLMTYNQFFNSKGHDDAYVFLNEMGNKCYISDENTEGQMQLYTSDKLGGEWSAPVAVKGINSGITEANYPFMMADGTTLYFAAKGQESIGGYDIFVTRYDSEDSQFLKPENVGMPFNSVANDYMYVIDEQTNIGYFATDRRQPKDKVCIYIFIPPTSRHTYPLDKYSDEQLRSLAEIRRIADTWGNGKERKQAVERMKNMAIESASLKGATGMSFIINDQVTYTSISQFRSEESLSLYKELTDTQKRLENMKNNLEKSRNYYAKAKAEDKRVLRTEILDAEQQLLQLTTDIKTLEKRIRNAENMMISNQ